MFRGNSGVDVDKLIVEFNLDLYLVARLGGHPGSAVKPEQFYVAIITPVIDYYMGGLEST